MKAMLSMTKVELDIISDVDMHLFLKKLAGVIFLISLKYIAKLIYSKAKDAQAFNS